jgi:hypothetical protein
MSLAGAVLFILVGLVTLSAYSHPGTESFLSNFKFYFLFFNLSVNKKSLLLYLLTHV